MSVCLLCCILYGLHRSSSRTPPHVSDIVGGTQSIHSVQNSSKLTCLTDFMRVHAETEAEAGNMKTAAVRPTCDFSEPADPN